MTKKVIIIDDSTTSLNLLKSKFAIDSWEVHGTTSAKDAYEMIFDVAPDIIITDAIMPLIGGFQFVRMTRQNEKISKIPIVVYSVLPESNAKFYIKEDLIEYFLTKNENIDELVEFANNLIEKYSLSEEYKLEILKTKFEISNPIGEVKIPEKLEESVIDKKALEQKIKEKYNFNLSDEKIFSEIFAILYPILDYDLCIVVPNPCYKKEKSIFFDIRDIIISPIFQSAAAEKYQAYDIVLFKKYAPNLKMITNEDEFYSKVEFSFEYKDKNIADLVFYSKEKSKWENEQNLEIIKDVLFSFFKARFINRNSSSNKKEGFSEKYFSEKFNILPKQEISSDKENIYTGIVSISNYNEITSHLAEEDFDILNSKISEKIMNCLEPEEQISKNDEDEYMVVIYVKDKKNAMSRFNCIINAIEQINYDNYSPQALIGACDCNIDGNYNIFEAQKHAHQALEEASKTEKTVIKNAE